VDVGRLALDGVDDEGVDVPDDRGVVLLDVAALGQLEAALAALGGLAEDVLVGDVHLPAGVAALDGLAELVGRGQPRVEGQLQDARERVERLGVEGVADGDGQLGALHLEGQDPVALGEVAADELEEVLGGDDLGEVHDLHVELGAEGRGDGLPGELLLGHEMLQGGGVRVLTLLEVAQRGTGGGHVIRRDERLVLDELDDKIVGGRHRRMFPGWKKGL